MTTEGNSLSEPLGALQIPQIPQIDMSLDDETIAAELYAALTTVGFATLIKHGLELSIPKAFAASKDFFWLPLTEKLRCGYRGHSSNRGYIAMGKEKFDDSIGADRKETYDINPDESGPDSFQPWPTMADGEKTLAFQENLTVYFNQMDLLHLRVMRLIAIGLGLDPDFFVGICNERHENLRLLHYPEIERPSIISNENREPIVRGAIHTDYGTITLLAQDNVGGLRVKCRDDSWVDVRPVPDSIVVNVGDMLQRLTNDIFKSNPHQVVELDGYVGDTATIPERYSIAFFCNANKDTLLTPLEQCCKGKPPKYEPVLAKDYLEMRLSQTIDHA